MSLDPIARMAVARIGLPVPLAKVVTIQAIADALGGSAGDVEAALMQWLVTRDLESECLEGLCPLLLMDRDRALPLMQKARAALPRPSIASELLASLVTGTLPFAAAWRGRHSGAPPALVDLAWARHELTEGAVIGPGFGDLVEELEEDVGLPFMRQWCYEFSELIRTVQGRSDGYFHHFFDSNQGQGGGLFAFRGHAARSAFLRMLVYAVEHWEMPEPVAYKLAEKVLPADPVLLKIRPQWPPAWVGAAQQAMSHEVADGGAVAGAILREVAAHDQQTLLHCALTIEDTPERVVDLAVFAFSHPKGPSSISSERVVGFHAWAVGRIHTVPDKLRALRCEIYEPESAKRYGFTPLLTPLLSERVGYMQQELISRSPFGPASNSVVPGLRLSADGGDGSFRTDTETVGRFAWWLWNWSPGRRRDETAPIGCMSSIRQDIARRLVGEGEGSLTYAWHLTIRTRSPATHQWASCERSGLVAP